jgi:hypothetical protein
MGGHSFQAATEQTSYLFQDAKKMSSFILRTMKKQELNPARRFWKEKSFQIALEANC